MKALGFNYDKPQLLQLLTQHGVPSPKYQPAPGMKDPPVPASRLNLTKQSFQHIAAEAIGQRDPREEVLRAFELFDSDNTGIITMDDLRKVAGELGEVVPEDELYAMIEEFDLEGKGGVGKEEFVTICMH